MKETHNYRHRPSLFLSSVLFIDEFRNNLKARDVGHPKLVRLKQIGAVAILPSEECRVRHPANWTSEGC